MIFGSFYKEPADQKEAKPTLMAVLCVSDAGGGQPSADLQRPGSSAAHPSRVASAVNQQRLGPLHPAQGARRGASPSALFTSYAFTQIYESGLSVKRCRRCLILVSACRLFWCESAAPARGRCCV